MKKPILDCVEIASVCIGTSNEERRLTIRAFKGATGERLFDGEASLIAGFLRRVTTSLALQQKKLKVPQNGRTKVNVKI